MSDQSISHSSSARPDFESVLETFEESIRSGQSPDIEQFVAGYADETQRGALLVELIKIEQELCWRTGEKRLLEHYLTRWGETLSQSQFVELVSAECFIRALVDEMPNFRELERRFPREVCEQIPLARIERNIKDLQQGDSPGNQNRQKVELDLGSTQTDVPARLLETGQNIRDTWTVDRFLGEGAFAEVWRVDHRFLGRQAMKVFKAVGMSIDEINTLLVEAQLLSRLAHPNIVKVFDANVTSTSRGLCGFFTMEYVAGGTLESFWRSYAQRRVPIDKAVDVIIQVCQGLAVAHRADPPIIHQDIKPQNILVGYEADGFRVRLSDFGLARHVNPLTRRATARGTFSFKGPEVMTDSKSDSAMGDIFSVGTTLYLLLTDYFPYCERKTTFEELTRDFHTPLHPPSFHNCLVDAELDRIVCKCLSVSPEDRYADAAELLSDLTAWSVQSESRQQPLQVATDVSEKPPSSSADISLSESEARRLATRALALSKQFTQLHEAADLMEEAFNHWPGLRTEFEYRVQMWRRGVVS